MSTLTQILGWTIAGLSIAILVFQGIAGCFVRKDDDPG